MAQNGGAFSLYPKNRYVQSQAFRLYETVETQAERYKNGSDADMVSIAKLLSPITVSEFEQNKKLHYPNSAALNFLK